MTKEEEQEMGIFWFVLWLVIIPMGVIVVICAVGIWCRAQLANAMQVEYGYRAHRAYSSTLEFLRDLFAAYGELTLREQQVDTTVELLPPAPPRRAELLELGVGGRVTPRH